MKKTFADDDSVQRIVSILAAHGLFAGAECDLDTALVDCNALLQVAAGCNLEIPSGAVAVESAEHQWNPIHVSRDLAKAICE